jgi:hypothetical protein
LTNILNKIETGIFRYGRLKEDGELYAQKIDYNFGVDPSATVIGVNGKGINYRSARHPK